MILWLCLLLSLTPCLCRALGSFVHCEPCDEKAMSMCPPTPVGCELVKEPGCGCCLTCALAESQACGVYTEPCAQGLRCLPRQGEEKPLHALLHGRAICLNEKNYRDQAKTERESREHEEPTTSEMAEETYSPKFRPKFRNMRISEHKVKALKDDQQKKMAKSKTLSDNNAHHRAPPEQQRHESELGPCRIQIETHLQEIKASHQIITRKISLPNCDRKGFYKRKQCKPSRGRKRGICWCVDRYGTRLPGSEFMSGSVQCHSFDSSNTE